MNALRRLLRAFRAGWAAFWDALRPRTAAETVRELEQEAHVLIAPPESEPDVRVMPPAAATADPYPSDGNRREVWVLNAKGEVQSVEVCKNSRELKVVLAGLAPDAHYQYWYNNQLRDWRPREG